MTTTKTKSKNLFHECHYKERWKPVNKLVISQNHRVAKVGRDLKRISGSNFHGKREPDEIIQHLVQLRLENIQQWAPYHIPGEIVSENYCVHCKTFLSYIERLSATWDVSPLSSPVAPSEERASVLRITIL